MQEKHISVRGDAGLIVAGDATHDGATANNQMRNVINIHHHGVAMNDASPPFQESRMSHPEKCPSCEQATRQVTHTRRWLFATGALALVSCGMAVYSAVSLAGAPDPALTVQGGLCHHDGRAHSPGVVARMADSQLYVCSPSTTGGVAFWESAEEAAKRRNAGS